MDRNRIVYRKAVSSDLSEISAIVAAVIPIMHSQDNYQWTEDYPRLGDFEKDIKESLLWVAELDSKVCGMVALTYDQPEEYGEVGMDVLQRCVVPHRMAVHPQYHKLGIAVRFMEIAEEIAKDDGLEYIRVDTNEKNAPMQALFVKMGFECLGKVSLAGTKPGLKFPCYQKKIL